MKKHIIIVAGGKGLRMGGDIPKQFLPVCGKPVLMRTLEAFHAYDSSIHIILVLPVSQQAYWQDLCQEYQFTLAHDIANGGDTRFHSVMNGLSLVETDGNFITAKGPGAAMEFAFAIVEKYCGIDKVNELKQGMMIQA